MRSVKESDNNNNEYEDNEYEDNESYYTDDSNQIVINRENTDSIVFSIIEKFKERSDFGMKKYGTNLDRTDLYVTDWIQHAQEEHMDAILYLEKLKNGIQTMEQELARSKYILENKNNSLILENKILLIIFLFTFLIQSFYRMSI